MKQDINSYIFLVLLRNLVLDFKSATTISIWFAVALISVVYLFVFGDKIGDVLFGVFFPIGLLVLVAVIVTVFVASQPNQTKS